MEAQPQTKDIAISHQHANGEIFEANNLEAARGMCPVLGKMSLEEAGLLLELEAMGKEHIANEPEIVQEESVIEKVEKVHSNNDEIKEVNQPLIEERRIKPLFEIEVSSQQITEPVVKEVGISLDRKSAETTHLASSNKEAIDKTFSSHDVDVPMPKLKLPEAVDDAFREQNLELIEAADLQNKLPPAGVTTVEASNPVPVALNQVKNVENQKAFVTEEHETVHPELLQADVSPVPIEAIDEVADTDKIVVELAAVEVAEEDAPIMYDRLEAEEVDSSLDGLAHSDHKITEEEVSLVTSEASQLDEERPTETTQYELQSLTNIPELAAPIVQIENAIEQLVEVMEQEETEQPGKITAILEKIITLPAGLESQSGVEVIVVEETLEELFTELFEAAGIDSSSELVDSFVKLTKAHYLDKLLEIPKDTESELPGLPSEVGTLEFLQQLQYGLSAMKQVVINFYEIGRSILRLYSYNLQTVHTVA